MVSNVHSEVVESNMHGGICVGWSFSTTAMFSSFRLGNLSGLIRSIPKDGGDHRKGPGKQRYVRKSRFLDKICLRARFQITQKTIPTT